jgi:transposase
VRAEGSDRRYVRSRRPSKLDAFADYIRARLAAALPGWIPATVMLSELRARGYTGSHSILRAFMAGLRPAKAVEPPNRFETAAGEQMQVDWAEFRVEGLRWYAFVAVLGYSRWLFGRFVEDQRFETLRNRHVAAFEAMGGVPRTVLYDNMATVVVARVDGQPQFHAGMQAFAKDYGFALKLCRPYRARTKGKVERVIRYVRESFFAPLVAEYRQLGAALTLDVVNGRFAAWQAEVANRRVHGTTEARPVDRLAVEQSVLQPLPDLQAMQSVRERLAVTIPVERSAVPLQRPLSVYDAYSEGVRP